MSEVPDYELLLNDYVMTSNLFHGYSPNENKMFSSKPGLQIERKGSVPASPPHEIWDPSKTPSPVVSASSMAYNQSNMFNMNPLTPPQNSCGNDELLRKMSESDIMNVLSPIGDNSSRLDNISPATLYQTSNRHSNGNYRATTFPAGLTSFSDAGIYYNNQSGSDNSDSDEDKDYQPKEIGFNGNVPSSNRSHNSSPVDATEIKKPKRKTRLCALSSQEKSERRKQQNRLAASRCRKKKQAALSEMENCANVVKDENSKLRDEIADLKRLVEELRKNQACPRKCCLD
jgi:hypothetical protein